MRHSIVRPYLLLLLSVLGLAGLWRGLQLYTDHLDRRDEAAASAVRASAQPKGPLKRPAGPAAANAEEIGALSSPDRILRLQAADLLLTRSVTPELMNAVHVAWAGSMRDDALREKLACLKVRGPQREALDFAHSLLPTDERGFAWTLPKDVACALKAVAERAGEDPERAQAALLRAVYSDAAPVRETACRGLENVHLEQFPVVLQIEVQSGDKWRQQKAIRAALALGAIDRLPGLVERALVDETRGLRDTTRAHLARSESPQAARIIARAIVQRPAERFLDLLAREREAQHLDVVPALLEIVADPSLDSPSRVTAVGIVVKLAKRKEVVRLRALRDLARGELRTALEDAIVVLDR